MERMIRYHTNGGTMFCYIQDDKHIILATFDLQRGSGDDITVTIDKDEDGIPHYITDTEIAKAKKMYKLSGCWDV